MKHRSSNDGPTASASRATTGRLAITSPHQSSASATQRSGRSDRKNSTSRASSSTAASAASGRSRFWVIESLKPWYVSPVAKRPASTCGPILRRVGRRVVRTATTSKVPQVVQNAPMTSPWDPPATLPVPPPPTLPPPPPVRPPGEPPGSSGGLSAAGVIGILLIVASIAVVGGALAVLGLPDNPASSPVAIVPSPPTPRPTIGDPTPAATDAPASL